MAKSSNSKNKIKKIKPPHVAIYNIAELRYMMGASLNNAKSSYVNQCSPFFMNYWNCPGDWGKFILEKGDEGLVKGKDNDVIAKQFGLSDKKMQLHNGNTVLHVDEDWVSGDAIFEKGVLPTPQNRAWQVNYPVTTYFLQFIGLFCFIIGISVVTGISVYLCQSAGQRLRRGAETLPHAPLDYPNAADFPAVGM